MEKILYVASEKKMLSVNVGILGRLSFQMEELKGLAFSQSSRDLFVSFFTAPLQWQWLVGWTHLCIELFILPEKIDTELGESDNGDINLSNLR